MISKRWLINYLLILLICLFTVIGNRYEVETGYQPREKISRLKPEDIDRIRIQTADTILHLHKTADRWKIESPFHWYANHLAIEQIINILNTDADTQIVGGSNSANLGLQTPQARLSLNDVQFLFGATNPIGQRRYLQTKTGLYLLADQHLPFFTLTALVDRRLLPRWLQLQRLTIGRTHLRKTENSTWQRENTTDTSMQFNRLVHNWQTLEANYTQLYKSTEIPLQKIICRLENGRNIEFYLLAIKPEIIIARPDLGLQYHFSASHYYGLLEPPEDGPPTI